MGEPMPVIVVGAGPVGLCVAAALASEQIPVTVLEAAGSPQTDWRASTFHAATLELLERIEVTGPMLEEGLAVPRYQYRDRREGLVAEFDLGVLADETNYPFRLQLNQQRLVAMLLERLERRVDVDIRFGYHVLEVDSTSDGVQVVANGPDGRVELESSYLIGADGASSTVRSSLGIAFDGFTYEQLFQIVSTSTELRDAVPDLADVNYVSDPDEWLFILRTPESWRVVWPIAAPITDRAALAEHLERFSPHPDGYEILDQQTYRVHQRVASSFVQGRALLAGDAAHINSPLGGVGLNSGIHDAFDGAVRLTRVLREGADPAVELDAYDAVRRRVAIEFVQADTERNTRRLAERDPEQRRRTNDEMRAIAADPERARAWLRRVTLLESMRTFGIGEPPVLSGADRLRTQGATPDAG